jgi:hypothetical protein
VKLLAELPVLTDAERSCLERYSGATRHALGEQLLEERDAIVVYDASRRLRQ